MWLPHPYQQGDNLEARLQIVLAAHEAGQAFTRTNGAKPMPSPMRSVAWHRPRSRQCHGAACGTALAERFIAWVADLNRQLGIPTTVAPLRSDAIPAIARAVLREAHPDYPVPRLMDQADCTALVRRLQAWDAIIDSTGQP